MAKIVIAGAANCPHFAKVELLADELAVNTPNFHVHKIVLEPEEWETWRQSICSRQGWNVTRSPLVWRELVDRGGKGTLIGGANEFHEYVMSYYGRRSVQNSQNLLNVAQDNLRYKQAAVLEERQLRALSQPVRVCVTSASGTVAYHLYPRLASGEVFGQHTELSLILYDTRCHSDAAVLDSLRGVQMELFDLAYPLLRSITITNDFAKAVEGCHYVILLSSSEDDVAPFMMEQTSTEATADKDQEPHSEEQTDTNTRQPREKKPSAETLRLQRYVNAMSYFGECIDRFAHKDCKILIASVDNENTTPICLNLHHFLQSLQRIPRHNAVGVSRPLERRAKAQLAAKLKVNTADVVDVIVWGDPSNAPKVDAESATLVEKSKKKKKKDKDAHLKGVKSFIDLTTSRVFHFDGAITGPDFYFQSTEETIWDKKWLSKEFKPLYEARFASIGKLRGPNAETMSVPALSTAHAISGCLRDWVNGDKGYRQEICSLCVPSPGIYGVPEGMIFSLPVRFQPPGEWRIVEDVEMTPEKERFILACVQTQKDQWNSLYPTDEPEDDADLIIDLEERSKITPPLDPISSMLTEYFGPEKAEILKPYVEKNFTAAELEMFKHNGHYFKECCQYLLPFPREDQWGDLEDLIQANAKPSNMWKLRQVFKVCYVTEEEVRIFKEDVDAFNEICKAILEMGVGALPPMKQPSPQLDVLSSLLVEFVGKENLEEIKPLAENAFTVSQIEMFKHNGPYLKECCEYLKPFPQEDLWGDLEDLIQKNALPTEAWKLRRLFKASPVTNEELTKFKEDPEAFQERCRTLLESAL